MVGFLYFFFTILFEKEQSVGRYKYSDPIMVRFWFGLIVAAFWPIVAIMLWVRDDNYD